MESLNITAFRVFNLLQWLQDKPLTVKELKLKFQLDLKTQRVLSADTIGLYINTLKTLGCEISRPSRSNGYRYELTYHPFGFLLSDKDIEVLARVKALGEEQFTFDEVLHLHMFIKELIRQTSLLNPQDVLQQLFETSRTIDYESLLPEIREIQALAEVQQLLKIVYDSPLNGPETFLYLPDNLIYQQGVVYVTGIQEGREEPVMLRVERIQSFEPIDHPEVHLQLSKKNQAVEPTVVIHFLGIEPCDIEPLGLGEVVHPPEVDTPEKLRVSLQTRDFFLLKQKLLSFGTPFDILEPLVFKLDMIETLVRMERFYVEAPNG